MRVDMSQFGETRAQQRCGFAPMLGRGAAPTVALSQKRVGEAEAVGLGSSAHGTQRGAPRRQTAACEHINNDRAATGQAQLVNPPGGRSTMTRRRMCGAFLLGGAAR